MPGSYRPSALATLTLLFDEGLGPLGESPDTDTVPQAVGAVVQQPPIVDAGATPGVRQASNLDNVKAFFVQPLYAEYKRTTHREPDTAKIKLNYLDVPIPAHGVRGGDLQIYMDNVEDEPTGAITYAQGWNSPGNSPILRPSNANLRFLGTIDTWEENIDDGTIEVTSRDYSALLHNKIVQPNVQVNRKLPLDLCVGALLATMRSPSIRLTVEAQEIRGVASEPGSLPAPAQYHPKSHGPNAVAHPTSEKMSYWDLIQEVCMQTGYLCYVLLDKLIITTAANLLDAADAAPLMVYGNNLKSLKFQRKFGKQKDQTVWVIAQCPDLGRTFVGAYPGASPPPPGPPQPDTSIAAPDALDSAAGQQQIFRYLAPPIGAPTGATGAQQFLTDMAYSAYLLRAKGTLTGSFSTDDTWSYAKQASLEDQESDQTTFDNVGGSPPTGGLVGVGPNHPDLYELQTGDPIQIEIRGLTADEKDGPPASLFAGMNSATAIQTYLVNRLNFQNPAVALEIAQQILSASRNHVYRVTTMTITFDSMSGLEVHVNFMDYAQAHSDLSKPAATRVNSGINSATLRWADAAVKRLRAQAAPPDPSSTE